MLLTFTTLQGFTKLVNKLWESDDKTVKTTILKAKDNPFLTEEAKEQLLNSIDIDDLESRWEGKPHIKQGLIYKEFNEVHKIDDFDYISLVINNPNRYEFHEGIDPHERTPHHWIRFLFDKQKDIIYIVDEIKAPYEAMLISDFSRLIKEKRFYNNKKSLNPVFCQIDTSSMKPDIITKHNQEDQEDVYTVRLEFLKNGIETILCTKDNAVGIGEVKKRLKIVKNFNKEIKKYPSLYIFKSCKGVIWEFSRYSWDSYIQTNALERNELLNRPLKKDDHFMDIIKYECIKMKINIDKDKNNEPEQDKYYGIGY
jgi:hypothetical protein